MKALMNRTSFSAVLSRLVQLLKSSGFSSTAVVSSLNFSSRGFAGSADIEAISPQFTIKQSISRWGYVNISSTGP